MFQRVSYLVICHVLFWESIYGYGGSSKVFNGRDAIKGEFPFIVCITGARKCGAAIVTMSKLITAAHCFKDLGQEVDLSDISVVGGTVNIRDEDEGWQLRNITKYQIHKDFAPKMDPMYFHDIAVAFLNKPFEPSPTLTTLKLASNNPEENKKAWYDVVSSGKTCFVIGWGHTRLKLDPDTGKERETMSSHMLKVIEVKPWTDKQCSETQFREEDMTSQGVACVKGVGVNQTTGTGDSGSPVSCDGFVVGHITGGRIGDEKAPIIILLYWPYIEYFSLSGDGAGGTGDGAGGTNKAPQIRNIPSLYVIFTLIFSISHTYSISLTNYIFLNHNFVSNS